MVVFNVRAFTAVVSMLLLSQPAIADFRALCVGVNCDKPMTDRLKCPFNRDAVVMHDMLRKQGIKSTVLFGEQATCQQVRRHLKKIAHSSKEGDVTFLLFSTHGEMRKGDYVALLFHEDMLTGREIIKLTSRIKGIVIIAVDTCHAGAILNNKTDNNVIILAACKQKQSARWIPLGKLPRNEPCGYLSRPLFQALLGKPKVCELVTAIWATEIPEPTSFSPGHWSHSSEKQEPMLRVPAPLLQVLVK
jgi:hypothetical protein